MKKEDFNAFLEQMKRDGSCIFEDMLWTAVPIGKGRVFYAVDLCGEIVPNLNWNMEPIAIEDENEQLYFMDYVYIPSLKDENGKIEQYRFFSERCREIKKIADKMLTYFYENLPLNRSERKKFNDSTIDNLAWLFVLKGLYHDPIAIDISDKQFLHITLGLKTIEEIVDNYCKEHMEYYIRLKTKEDVVIERAVKYQGDPLIRLYKFMKETEAKFVTVVFEKNGITAKAKISPFRIQSNIVNRNYFGRYEFKTGKEGESLYERIFGKGYDQWNADNRLYPSDIIAVEYKRKELFRRE